MCCWMFKVARTLNNPRWLIIVDKWGQIATVIWVNNGRLPDGTKQSSEPMLIYSHQGPVTFIWGWFLKDTFVTNR